MDSVDRDFFSKLHENLKEDIRDIKNHLTKTCDELHKVDILVTELKADLKNHLKYMENNNSQKFTQKINRPQWIIVGATIGATLVGFIALINTIKI